MLLNKMKNNKINKIELVVKTSDGYNQMISIIEWLVTEW